MLLRARGPCWLSIRVDSAAGPVLYEAITDPNMPPLPPQLRFETVRNMTRAFMKGDPAAREVLRHTIRARRKDLTSR